MLDVYEVLDEDGNYALRCNGILAPTMADMAKRHGVPEGQLQFHPAGKRLGPAPRGPAVAKDVDFPIFEDQQREAPQSSPHKRWHWRFARPRRR